MIVGRILPIFVFCTVAYTEQIGDNCDVKSTRKSGTCKLLSDCALVEQQAREGLSPTICGFHHHTDVIVCCENDYNQVQPNDNTFDREENTDRFVYPDSVPLSTNNRLRTSEKKCNEYSRSTESEVQAIALTPESEPISIKYATCAFNGLPLIVGGTPASPGEFPFMAAVGFLSDNKLEWRCGGTLISDYYVMTAAHCTGLRDVGAPKVVRLGDLDLKRSDDGSAHVDYDIENIVRHPQYKYPQRYNDIALLKTKEQVAFTKFIRPACLYTKPEVSHTKAIAMGWGKTEYTAAETNNKLLKVVLEVYDNQYCHQTYKIDYKLPDGIKSSMLCAGERKGGRDTCQGDSGGPLVITNKDNNCKFFVIGVTSFGKFCGATNTPAVYTRVSEYISWIEETIW